MAKWTKTETAEAIESLRDMLKPGDTVYTSVKSVAKSGMSRTIACYIIKNNEPLWISRLVAKAIGHAFDDDKEAVRITGAGMDMGWALIYELSSVLFPGGFVELGTAPEGNQIRPFNPLDAQMAVTAGVKFRGRNDGGYALKQRWL
jgi:hypothetical protein